MYIYHNTSREYFINILNDGKLTTGEKTKNENYNIHKNLQKYIYFNITKKKGFKYLFAFTFIFPANILYDYEFYINVMFQNGLINENVVKYKKYTKYIDVILKILFDYIIKFLKKDKCSYNPYYISQLFHELFIKKELSLSKAKYILLPIDMDINQKNVFKNKITELYPHIKIIYNDYKYTFKN